MMRDLYMKLPINHGIGALWRYYKLNKAMNLLYNELEVYCHRYWSAEIIAIKPIWQSNGFGSIMLNESNKYIQQKMSLNKMDNKVPIIVCTLTTRSVKFYVK